MRLKVISIISIIVSVSLIFGTIYYVKSGPKIINESIPDNKFSAKELVKISKIYVDKFWSKKNYHISKINMELDKDQRGNVEIWYEDDNENKNGVPNIITVEINTKSKKILKIATQPRDSKIATGDDLNIEKWSIDSNEAINIAKERFKSKGNFELAYITGEKQCNTGKETWDIILWNEVVCHIKIDVYTGEIYTSEEQ